MDEPIKTQVEADEVKRYLIKSVVATLNISVVEATRRVAGLLKSGILNTGNAEDPESQMRIDAFLQIPSSEYEHLK